MEEETRRIDSYKRMINFGARVILLITQALMFTYIWYEFYARDESAIMWYWRRGNWAVIGIYVLVLFFFTRAYGGYKIGYQRIYDMTLWHTIAIVCSNIFAYVELTLIHRSYVNAGPLMAFTVLEVLITFVWIYFTRVLFVRLFPARRLLVISDQRSSKEIVQKINERPDKYKVCEEINVSAGREKVIEKINQYHAVLLCDIRSYIRNDILKYCFGEGIRIYVTPKLSDIIIGGSEEMYLFDSPLYLSRNQGLSADQLIVKRIMDIVISVISLIICAPFMLITALGIKLYDGGPVFYYQDRLTRDGKIFKIIKFRSMGVDSERKGARLATEGDVRITPVGKIIRRIHFDEIPQLINVLRGDMSFVGPRPERPEIADVYKEKIPEFDFRLKVKAGLTGYAQVYGRYNTTPYDKLKLDMTYIESYSVMLDLKIILSTIKVIFQKENTHGFDERNAVPDERVDIVEKQKW